MFRIDIEKVIAEVLTTQSGLLPTRVLNGASIRGVDLVKEIEDSNVFVSLDLSDNFLIFEITKNNEADRNLSQEIDDKVILSSTYDVAITIYGNTCVDLAETLKARLESQLCRYQLQTKHLWLVEVGDIEQVNEFVNQTIWPRSDLSFTIACEKEISLVEDYEKMDSYNLDVN